MERQTQILKATEREAKIQTHAHRRETKGQMKDLDHMNFKNTSSKTEKDKYPMISLICGILKKKMAQMNLFTKQK